MSTPVFDVRTPGEFVRGHVPGAVSFPLFSDQERHDVGICYKNKGRDAAVKLGLQLVGPRLADFVAEAEKLAPEKSISMYCWRGGMRSASMAWLLRTAGFEVQLMRGGYKAWRNEKLRFIEGPMPLINLGGLTGVGKTDVIRALAAAGEQCLDLEQLANHRGSAFGAMGPQPTTEQFENELGSQIQRFDLRRWIWVEDESRSVSKVYLNYAFFQQMRSAPFVYLQKSIEERVQYLCELYGSAPKDQLIDAFERIRKRMGGQFVSESISAIEAGDLSHASRLALRYYDKTYSHSLSLRQPAYSLQLDTTGLSAERVAEKLVQWKNQNLPSSAMDPVAGAK